MQYWAHYSAPLTQQLPIVVVFLEMPGDVNEGMHVKRYLGIEEDNRNRVTLCLCWRVHQDRAMLVNKLNYHILNCHRCSPHGRCHFTSFLRRNTNTSCAADAFTNSNPVCICIKILAVRKLLQNFIERYSKEQPSLDITCWSR